MPGVMDGESDDVEEDNLAYVCQDSPLVLEWPSLKSAMFVSLSVSSLY